MQVGRVLKDPRSTGQGLALLTWSALVCDSYAEALEYSEQSLAVAVAPHERNAATSAKGCALVLLRRTQEGLKLLDEQCRRAVRDGDLYTLAGNDGIIAVGKALQGNIREGIYSLERAILRLEKEGYRRGANWYRLFLSELYLEVVAGEKPPLLVVLKNLPIILKVIVTASARVPALTNSVLENRQMQSDGHHFGRAHMILGLFYKAKKKRPLALEQLSEASAYFLNSVEPQSWRVSRQLSQN
jgi:tetratricopeptide (TPR) repeat protein